MTARQPVYIDGGWTWGPPRDGTNSRDPYWVVAYELAREAVEQAGKHCIACGGYLWSRAETGRLYCDDTCKRRHQRRRDRYRKFLREHNEPCQFCSSEVA